MSLEFYTNEELQNELFSRESFKGILLSKSGEKNNIKDGNGGCNIRISKGMAVQDILSYMKVALDVLHEKYPAAFVAFFGPDISQEE